MEHQTAQREDFDFSLNERTAQIVMNDVMAIETDEDELKTESIEIPDLISPVLKPDFSLDGLRKLPEGRYRFIRSIGFGGMKTVTEVYDRDTGRNVAMASIPDASERKHTHILHFVREAFLTAKLEHPNIVPVHDIGIDSTGVPYFTMKLLHGYTLARLIKKIRSGEPFFTQKYTEGRLLFIFMRICNAIGFAHSQKIIHLDLKPDNIYVGEFGEVLVIDWGLAKYFGEIDTEEKDDPADLEQSSDSFSKKIKTQSGVVRGTPGYMSPEQAAGLNQNKDVRSDIYSLGAILYTMLTLRRPFPGMNVEQILHATVKGALIAPSQLDDLPRQIPAALEAIVMKAMHRNPDLRYQNVNELREDLFAYIGGYATTAESPGMLKKSAMFLLRNIYSVMFWVLLILLFGICVVMFWLFRSGVLEISLN